jgi:7-cyano-7-deazaguanine synthase
MTTSSAIVLLSSGLDSTVNLFKAHRELKIKKVLTFDYGQRAAKQEIAHSQKICQFLKLDHQIIDLPWLQQITSTSLVNTNQDVPQGSDIEIDNYEASVQSAKAVWVPNRNGVFLNIAAAFADSLKTDFIIPGFNVEEATTFADNSADFLQATDVAFAYSTSAKVKTKCYTINMNKTEIVALGRELNVPFDLMWPCYFGAEKICLQCESCQRFLRALEA